MVYTMVYHVHGACKGNGRPGSIATTVAVETLQFGSWASSIRRLPSTPPPTNQRAEIMAVILALELALQKYQTLECKPKVELAIYSESRYATFCMNEWMYKWQDRGWRNAHGGLVANDDVIKLVFELHNRVSEQMGKISYELGEAKSRASKICYGDLDTWEQDRQCLSEITKGLRAPRPAGDVDSHVRGT